MILDTNAVSGILAGDMELEQVLVSAERHHLPVIVLGEYRFGLLGSRRRNRLGQLLELLEQESIVLVTDRETARHYATVRGELKKQGTPIPENDVWISALSRQHQLPVVSRDTHFDVVPDVRRIGW